MSDPKKCISFIFLSCEDTILWLFPLDIIRTVNLIIQKIPLITTPYIRLQVDCIHEKNSNREKTSNFLWFSPKYGCENNESLPNSKLFLLKCRQKMATFRLLVTRFHQISTEIRFLQRSDFYIDQQSHVFTQMCLWKWWIFPKLDSHCW